MFLLFIYYYLIFIYPRQVELATTTLQVKKIEKTAAKLEVIKEVTSNAAAIADCDNESSLMLTLVTREQQIPNNSSMCHTTTPDNHKNDSSPTSEGQKTTGGVIAAAE